MSLELYQEQLLQTQEALKTCDNEEDRANLCSLENDLKELISLESYESEGDDQNEKSSEEISDVENLEEDKKVSSRRVLLVLDSNIIFLGTLQALDQRKV